MRIVAGGRTIHSYKEMGRCGHLFRSDSHDQAMDVTARTIDSGNRAKASKNAHRKWWDFAH
jgi:hypothetical protein